MMEGNGEEAEDVVKSLKEKLESKNAQLEEFKIKTREYVQQLKDDNVRKCEVLKERSREQFLKMKEEITEKKKESAEKDERIDALEKELQETRESKGQIRSQVDMPSEDAMSQKIKLYEDQLQAANRELEIITRSRNDIAAEVDHLRQIAIAKEELEISNTELQEKVSKLEADLSSVRSSFEQNEKEFVAMRSTSELQASELKAAVDQLEKKLTEKESLCTSLEEKLSHLFSEEDIQKRIAHLETPGGDQGNAESSNNQPAFECTACASLSKELRLANEAVADARELVEKLRSEKNEEVTLLEQRLEQIQNSVREKEIELEEARSQNKNNPGIVDHAKNESRDLVQELQANIAEQEAQIAKLQAELQTFYSQNNSDLVEKNNFLTSEVEQLKEEITLLRGAKVTAANEMMNENDVIEESGSERSARENANEGEEEDRDVLVSSLSNLKEELSSKEIHISEMTVNIASLEGQLKSKSEEIMVKDSRISDLESEVNEMHEKFKTTKAQFAETVSTMETLELKLREEQQNSEDLKRNSAEELRLRLETCLSEQEAIRNSLQETLTARGEAALAEMKQAHGSELESLQGEWQVEKERMQKQISDLEKEVSERISAINDLKSNLGVSDSDKVELSSTLSRVNNKVQKLEMELKAKQSVLDGIDAVHAEELRKSEEAIQDVKLHHQEELNTLEGRQAEAVATRLDLEAKIETLQMELDSERSEKASKLRQAKSFIETLHKKSQTKLEQTEADLTKNFQEQMNTQREELQSNIDKLKAELERKEKGFLFQLEEKQSIIRSMEETYLEHLDRSKREAEAIRMTEKEMNSVIETKLHETEQHKRLRKAAKQETLSLAKKLEEQSASIELLGKALEDFILPRSAQLAGAIKELEWHLDATLSAVEAQQQGTAAQISRSQSWGSNLEENAQSASEAESEESEDEGDQMSDSGGSITEKTGRESLLRRKSHVDLSVQRVSVLQNRVSKSFDSVQRALEKTRSVCGLALEEKSVLNVFSRSLRRAIDDCMVSSGRVPPQPPTGTVAQVGNSVGSRSRVNQGTRYVELQQRPR